MNRPLGSPTTESFLARALMIATLAIALAGCQTGLTRPDDSGISRAQRYVKQGRHSEAGEVYQRLANAQRGAARDALLLDAARAWLEAGQMTRALAAVDSVTGELPANDSAIAMIGGYRFLRDGEPQRSIDYLSRLRTDLPARYLGLWYELRGRAFFQMGDSARGVSALVERELWLGNGEEIRGNRELIWRALTALIDNGERFDGVTAPDAVSQGWLALANAQATGALNAFGRSSALREWLEANPNHPGRFVVEQDDQSLAGSFDYPDTIAVLLPLSGRFAGTAAAVRDGLMAAYLNDGERLSRPALRFYDTGSEDAGQLAQRAQQDGARFIIGPLLKNQVEAVASIAQSTPVLALNTLPDDVPASTALFQFSLAPEHEAQAVARRAVSEGMTRAVALVPNSAWGERLLNAFSTELASLGGDVLSYQTYESGDSDFAGPITTLLNLNESRARMRQVAAATGDKYEFEPRRRRDAQFVFVATNARQGRLIRPAFLYHFAEDMPIFATATAYEDDAQANGRDLDGLVFADMPWVIAPDQNLSDVQRAFARHWPSRVSRRSRLYAMGYDAYRMIPELLNAQPLIDPWPGATGNLSLGQSGQVRRQLDVAVIRGGRAEMLGRIDEVILDEDALLELEQERTERLPDEE
ncbi:MAG: penicillin-binding protein activator [Gammaproteobacteria bacterium]